MTKLSTFDDVLAVWGTPKALSDALGVQYVTAQQMMARRSIAVGHWPKLIELLKGKGYAVTTDDLAVMWGKAATARAADKSSAPSEAEGQAA